MAEYKELKWDKAIPVVFCERQKKWLPMEEHAKCEFCVAPVCDENDDPVSFICTYHGAKRVFQQDWEEHSEEGRGSPG